MPARFFAEVVLDDNNAFEELCRTIASAPHCGRAFPRSTRAFSPRMERLEDVVAWLWPYFGALDPQCADCVGVVDAADVELLPTNPFFFALMRDATRRAGCKSGRARGERSPRGIRLLLLLCTRVRAQRLLAGTLVSLSRGEVLAA